MLIKKSDLTQLAIESGVWESLCKLVESSSKDTDSVITKYKIVEVTSAKGVE
jgi:hypothetical protein